MPAAARLRSLVSILCAALLAACVAGGPDPATVAGPQTLALRSWPSAGPPRAMILALHGFGDAGDLTFARAAAAWSARGILVYAPDQRGFGANPSRRRWPGEDALVADAVALSRALRARHPDLPLTVVGHSMGGGVALAAAAEGLDADGLVLAGPAIAGGAALNPALRVGAYALATVLPDKRWTGAGIVAIQPTDNIDAIREALADPRHFGDPSSVELYGLVRLMDKAAAAAPEVATPTLTLMGARDEVLRPDRVRAVHDAIPGAQAFRLYPEGWHWLFRDLQAPAVWREVGDFALARR